MMYDSSDRGLASMTRAAAMAVALCFSASAPAVAADQPPTPAPAMSPAPVKGEFDDQCAMGLASGAGGRRLDAGAPPYFRRHGFRRNLLISSVALGENQAGGSSMVFRWEPGIAQRIRFDIACRGRCGRSSLRHVTGTSVEMSAIGTKRHSRSSPSRQLMAQSG